MQHIRNIAIIAHVDHGKTTLVDCLLKQSGTFRSNQQEASEERLMDSMDLEKEKGITIRAKNAAFKYKDFHVNIVDTPGHADFGGEVERIMNMIDGVLLVVDSAEGPQAQTRFVLRKALEAGAKPIVVINKIDRPDARIDEIHSMVFDLFIELGATDDQANFPVIYASGRNGVATTDMTVEPKNLKPLFDAILDTVPPPVGDDAQPLQFQVMALTYDQFVGKIAVGRVFAGKIRKNQKVTVVKQKDGSTFPDTVVVVQEFDRLARKEVDEVRAGDICCVVGIDDADIGDTICEFEKPLPMPPLTIDEPTLDMVFKVNDSPFASKDGKPLTSRELRARLDQELQHNVALRVVPGERESEFIVSGRGLLHLGVLLETMRREGSEIAVGKPRVIVKDIGGVKSEPYEHLVVEVPADHQSVVMKLVLERQGEFQRMETHRGLVQVEFHVPARSLIGLRTKMLTATQGTVIMHHNFLDYRPAKGVSVGRANGVYISKNTAKVTAYSCDGLDGTLFVAPGDEVYEGQVVGQAPRDRDLIVNVTDPKPLTNMRASGSDAKAAIKPPVKFSMEMALEFIEDDELVEITPAAVRMRKLWLKESERKKYERSNKG
jgi:GTP-binding protein